MKKASYFSSRLPAGYNWSFDEKTQRLTYTCTHNHTRNISSSQAVNRFSIVNRNNNPPNLPPKTPEDVDYIWFCADCNKSVKQAVSQENWRQACEAKGFRFLSHDPKTRELRYLCRCGEERKTNDSNLNHSQGGCRQCSQTEHRLTLAELQAEFIAGGCHLLTTQYNNNKQLLSFICNCGMLGEVILSDFRRGQRCPGCQSTRTKATCLQKYGVENVAQSEEAKQATKITCLQKYGVEHHSQHPDIQAMKEATCLQNYGVPTVLMLPTIQQQAQNAMREKYGFAHGFQVPAIREKIRQQTRERYGTDFNYQSPLFWEEYHTRWREQGVEFHTQLDQWKEKIKGIMMERYNSECYLTSENCKKQMLEKYGVEHASQAEEVKEKIRATCLEKYGTEFFLLSEEMKRQMLEKYGVEHASQAEEVKEKIRATCLEKYGTEYFITSDEMKRQMLEKYGVEHASQAEEVKEKIRATCLEKYGTEYFITSDEMKRQMLEKYGVEHASQAEEVKEKIRATCLEKYGTEYFITSDESKKRMMEKYGTEYFLRSEEYKRQMVEKFGVESPMQCEQLFRKAMKTAFSSKEYTFPSSNKIVVMGYEGICIDILLGKRKDPWYSGPTYTEEQISTSPPPIPYFDSYANKQRIYYPDLLAGEQIIEVKSVWTFNLNYQVNHLKFLETAKKYSFQLWIFNEYKQLVAIVCYQNGQPPRSPWGEIYHGGPIGEKKKFEELPIEDKDETGYQIAKEVEEEC